MSLVGRRIRFDEKKPKEGDDQGFEDIMVNGVIVHVTNMLHTGGFEVLMILYRDMLTGYIGMTPMRSGIFLIEEPEG